MDTLRGIAMVLVIYAHCHQSLDPASVHARVLQGFELVTDFAAVAFVAIAGAMLGYLYGTAAEPAAQYRQSRRRALAFLLLAHPAITLTRFFFYHPDLPLAKIPAAFFDRLVLEAQVTDTIAACILIATPALVRPGVLKSWLIPLLLALTPAIIFWSSTASEIWRFPQALLFGGTGDGWPNVPWPLLPWLAVFLCGTFGGRRLAEVRLGRLPAACFAAILYRWSGPLVAVSLVYGLGYLFLKHLFGSQWNPRVFELIYPGQTTGLLPGYLAVLMLLAAILLTRIDLQGRWRRFAWMCSVFGRTSLFTFVTHFVFVQSIPALLGWKGELTLAGVWLLFLAATVLTWCLAYGYGRLRGLIPRNR